jgi:hypothetical protein
VESSFKGRHGNGRAENGTAGGIHLIASQRLVGASRCRRANRTNPAGLSVPYLNANPQPDGESQGIAIIGGGAPLAGPTAIGAKAGSVVRKPDFVACLFCHKLKHFSVCHLSSFPHVILNQSNISEPVFNTLF